MSMQRTISHAILRRERKVTDFGVVHCSATPPHWNEPIEVIHGWHLKRGIRSALGSQTGYHILIDRDARGHRGRKPMEIGAHCRGVNDKSVGVCLYGGIDKWGPHGKPEMNFTDAQMDALAATIEMWLVLWPNIRIVGHNELNPAKACPSFDVQEWLHNNDEEDEHGSDDNRTEGDDAGSEGADVPADAGKDHGADRSA